MFCLLIICHIAEVKWLHVDFNVLMATDVGKMVSHVACLMTLDFSRRYSEIFAPITAPVGVNFISKYFPKRLELSLMAVHALPKASTRGFT